MLKNKKVLITGGAGFIGSNLIERFIQQNNFIVCLDNFATGKRENIEPFLGNPNFRLIEGDIRDIAVCKKAVEGVDVVLHQAALGSVPRSIKDPVTTNNVNIGGFVNMLSAAKDAGIKRFVYAASSSTYGDHPTLPKVEDRIGKPLSPYAITKYVNELYAEIFSNLYGIETIGLRYFNVFGRRQDPNGAYAAAIPKFIKLLINHEPPLIFGDGEQSRDFTPVDNVVQANLLACEAPKEAFGEAYNIACGERISVNQLASLIRDIVGTDTPFEYADARPGDVKHSLADIGRAREELGYTPEVELEEGLRRTVEWYRSVGG